MELIDDRDRFTCKENGFGGDWFDEATEVADAADVERRLGWEECRCMWDGSESRGIPLRFFSCSSG